MGFFLTTLFNLNGEPSLTAIGTITVPDNSVISPNTILRAGGAIDIGENVLIGTGSEIYSEVKIDVDKGTEMGHSVILEIAGKGSIKYDCSDYNYQSLEMGSDEISTFCGSQVYKQRALFKRDLTEEDEKENRFRNLSTLAYNIYPNPNTGIFELQFTSSNEDVHLEVLDAFGRVVQTLHKPAELNMISVDISGTQNGMYFVKVVGTNSAHLIKKIVKY